MVAELALGSWYFSGSEPVTSSIDVSAGCGDQHKRGDDTEYMLRAEDDRRAHPIRPLGSRKASPRHLHPELCSWLLRSPNTQLEHI